MASKLKSSIGHAQTLSLKGGPWDGLDMTVRPRDRSKGDHSLPIRVGAHVGRYNLNNGEWRAME